MTLESLKAKVKEQHYHVVPGTTVTLCTLVLENGFAVTGESACASPELFDEELGKRLAYQRAIEKVWPLEGYLLKEQLSD